MLVGMIDARDSDAAREAVRSFHAWMAPRILASAALTSSPSPRKTPKRRTETSR
jgi:hypothetical protein